VFTPRQVRALKIAVIVMGVLLVAGFAFVLAAIVYQASRLGEKPEPAAAAVTAPMALPEGLASELPIPVGAEVTTLALDGDRLAVHLKSQAGAEIAVIDLATGKVLSRIKLRPE
jgi:hypothetical protein